MSSRRNDCTVMTPLYRSWRRAKLTPADVGFMCATIARSAAPRRRRQCSITRATERANIPRRHLANYAGIFQADAYSGYNKLYEPDRKAGPILEAACWVHARRPFFVMADVAENARRKA